MSLINIVADTVELLAGGLAGLYCCLGARPGRLARAHKHDLTSCYPELDGELDLIWHCYAP